MQQKHTKELIALREQRLRILEKRQATFGLSTPPEVEIEIEQTRAEIERLRAQLQREVIRDLVLETERPVPSPGLMLLVGPGRFDLGAWEQSASDAIDYHRARLRHCWLIGSAGKRGSLEVALELGRLCEQKGVAAHVWHVEDAFSVQETYDLVDWLYAYEVPASGLGEQEIIADVTGATKPMSIGMLLVCGTRWPIQYMVRQAEGPSIPLLLQVTLRRDV